VPSRHRPRSRQDDELRFARTCYDHLAGRLGVAIADALCQAGHIVLSDDGGEVTPAGERFLCEFGVDLAPKPGRARLFCRPCLDWSERRYHLAGRLGAELLRRCVELGWLARQRDTRAVRLTPAGRAGLRATWKVSLDDSAGALRMGALSDAGPGRRPSVVD
jgi:hypothetical protein